MALLARLTKEEYPDIAILPFCAALREYARAKQNLQSLETVFDIPYNDTQWLSLIALIDNEPDERTKVLKTLEILDLLTIHEWDKSNPMYPDAFSIAIRLGI